MSPSRPLTSQRTYSKSMTLTWRSTCRFPTQVSGHPQSRLPDSARFSSFLLPSLKSFQRPHCRVLCPSLCRGQVSVSELQRAASEGRRPSSLAQPGRLQEEEGADLMQPPQLLHEPSSFACVIWRHTCASEQVSECNIQRLCLNVVPVDCPNAGGTGWWFSLGEIISWKNNAHFLLFVILHNHTHWLSCAFYATCFTPMSDSVKVFFVFFFL